MAAFLTPLLSVIDRVLPDKAANDAAKAALTQSMATGELAQIQGQIDIDKQEAVAAAGAKNSFVQFFVAGWRPAIGWLCGLGLLWQFFLAPICGLCFQHASIPKIDSASLNDLLMALLGMGALRTVDKYTGATPPTKGTH